METESRPTLTEALALIDEARSHPDDLSGEIDRKIEDYKRRVNDAEPPPPSVTVEAYVEGMVADLRELTDALMQVDRYIDAHKVLGALLGVQTLYELDDFENIAWPPEVYADAPNSRDLRWVDGHG